MKKLLMLFVSLFVFLFAGYAVAATITLEWDANTESDLAGYRIYKSNVSGDYTEAPADVGNVTTHEIKDLADGPWFFVATAYDTDNNESTFSNEVTVTLDTAAPGSPANVKVTITGRNVRIEAVD